MEVGDLVYQISSKRFGVIIKVEHAGSANYLLSPPLYDLLVSWADTGEISWCLGESVVIEET